MKSLTRQEEQILLVIHHLGDEAYLVSIRSKLKELTGKYLDVGTIYVPLKRLHLNGYLGTRFGEPIATRGGKAIKYYRITKRGYQALEEARALEERLWDGVIIPSIST